MKKVVVALGLSRLTVPQKIEYARFIVASMTGNTNFTTPSPALTIITANANALETASITAKGGGKDETAAMHTKEVLLDLSLKSLAGYIEGIANTIPANSEAIVLSSGINLKRQPAARQNGFRLSPGSNSGEIQMRTNSDLRAVFTWEMTQTPTEEASWTKINSSTRAQFLVTGLVSGTRYYFRVSKTNKDGTGPLSNVLDMYAS